MQDVSVGRGRVQRRGHDPGLLVSGIPKNHPCACSELEQHPPSIVRCRGGKFKGQFERALCEVGQPGRAKRCKWVNHAVANLNAQGYLERLESRDGHLITGHVGESDVGIRSIRRRNTTDPGIRQAVL